MVLKEKSSEVGKSTSELANHTSKSDLPAQIDLKVKNADVEKTRKPEMRQKLGFYFPKLLKLLKSVNNYSLWLVSKSIDVLGGSHQSSPNGSLQLRDTTHM